jgi:hypothetical protein
MPHLVLLMDLAEPIRRRRSRRCQWWTLLVWIHPMVPSESESESVGGQELWFGDCACAFANSSSEEYPDEAYAEDVGLYSCSGGAGGDSGCTTFVDPWPGLGVSGLGRAKLDDGRVSDEPPTGSTKRLGLDGAELNDGRLSDASSSCDKPK